MSLDDDMALLRRLDIFAEIDPACLQVLAFTAERRTFVAGEVLFNAGEPAMAAYVVIEGEAAMRVIGSDGATQVQRIGRGDLIGETALLSEGVRRSDVQAVTGVEVMSIGRDLFGRLMMEFPEMTAGLARAALQRLAALAEDLRALDVPIDHQRAWRQTPG